MEGAGGMHSRVRVKGKHRVKVREKDGGPTREQQREREGEKEGERERERERKRERGKERER